MRSQHIPESVDVAITRTGTYEDFGPQHLAISLAVLVLGQG